MGALNPEARFHIPQLTGSPELKSVEELPIAVSRLPLR